MYFLTINVLNFIFDILICQTITFKKNNMKKLRIIFLMSLVLTNLTGWAQSSSLTVAAKGPFTRAAAYTCAENSLFGQLPVISGGFFADDYFPSSAGDDYTVLKPFNTMRFWGFNYDVCPPGTSQTFIITFYQRNAGDPTIPGPQFSSYTLTVIPQPIILGFGSDYQADVTFPTQITLLDGWVAITRVNPGDGCWFAWEGDIGAGGNAVSYYQGAWWPSDGQLSFCLGGGCIYTIDQNQPDGSVYMAAFSQTDLAQSFIPSAGIICGAGIGASLYSGESGTGDITISLWDNLPNAGGNQLATGTVNASLSGSWIWVDVFWPGVAVTPGDTYYLVFTSTNSGLAINGSIYNPYSNGMVFANPGYGPFPEFDYTFRTYSCDCNAPVIPLNNWALILGAVLIGTFAFIYYRRIV
jgi:hypothetical protein